MARIDFEKLGYKDPRIGKKRPEHSKLMKQLCKEEKITGFGKKTEYQKMKISERNKKWIKENGHPRGMLGKKHTKKTKELISKNGSLNSFWKNGTETIKINDYKQFLSDKAKEQHRSGSLNNRVYSRGKMGTYNINGKNIFFRSLWEVNYALYLDFLKKNKNIEKWEYETDTFWFEKIKRGVRSYKPDFKIFNKNGTFEYHEVKGWMDPKSITKLKRMKKYYPEVKIIVVDGIYYNDLKRKVGRMLKFYSD